MQGLETISRDETANQCMASQGEKLVTALLRAVALTCPVRMLGSMAMMLFTLFKHQRFGSAVKACFKACMQSDNTLGSLQTHSIILHLTTEQELQVGLLMNKRCQPLHFLA